MRRCKYKDCITLLTRSNENQFCFVHSQKILFDNLEEEYLAALKKARAFYRGKYRAYGKAWREKNRERHKATQKRWHEKNKLKKDTG